VGSRRLTAWAMTRPYENSYCFPFDFRQIFTKSSIFWDNAVWSAENQPTTCHYNPESRTVYNHRRVYLISYIKFTSLLRRRCNGFHCITEPKLEARSAWPLTRKQFETLSRSFTSWRKSFCKTRNFSCSTRENRTEVEHHLFNQSKGKGNVPVLN
jgi:hypothetical protein